MFDDYKKLILEWRDPIECAKIISYKESLFAFLHSSSANKYSGKSSFLAFSPNKILKGNDSRQLKAVDNDQWFGYLGYDLKNTIYNFAKDKKGIITNPYYWLIKYNIIIQFDNIQKEMIVYYKNDFDISILNEKDINHKQEDNMIVDHIESNMTKEEYLYKVKVIKDRIKEGVLSQANLTRKFFGKIRGIQNYFDIFIQLCKLSPSPFSCYLAYGELKIISSSPEQFLVIDKNKNVTAVPIKGTIKKERDAVLDLKQINKLKYSSKDRAENLMIVDLMRNDFARSCIPSSIKVPELFEINTLSTLHHMVSAIKGKIKHNASNLEFIRNCFPPGSMTGAPKIKAMQLCSHLEIYERGIYSGVIGRLSKNATVDLSVVIRTLVIKRNVFEFQVGGAIIYDSDPEKEWEETLVKASAISKVLGIKLTELERI